MPSTIPSWLTHMIEAKGPRSPFASDYSKAKSTVLPGQLRYVNDPSSRVKYLLLILAINEGVAEAILCTAELDLWDDTDVVLDSSESGLPYSVLAQAYIPVAVPVTSLGQHVGDIELSLCEAIRHLRDGEAPMSLWGRLGMSLQGPRDSRWPRKADEAAIAWSLSSALL